MGRVQCICPLPEAPPWGFVYWCAGPTMRHLQKLKKKKKMTNAQQMPGGCPRLELTEPLPRLHRVPLQQWMSDLAIVSLQR